MGKNLEIFFGSFYRYKPYLIAAHEWKGIAGYYLALACLLCTVCCQIKYQILFTEVSNQVQNLSHNVPGISVKNGRLLLKSEAPLVIGAHGRKRPLLIIDTTADEMLTAESAPMVVRDQNISIYGFGDQDVTSVPKITLPLRNVLGNTELDLDPSEIAGLVSKICLGLSLAIFIVTFAFLFASSVLQALFWGGLAFLVRRSVTSTTAYLPLVRASALALTPSLVVRASTGLFGLDLPFVLDVLVLVIYFAYLYFAYHALFRSGLAANEVSVASVGDGL